MSLETELTASPTIPAAVSVAAISATLTSLTEVATALITKETTTDAATVDDDGNDVFCACVKLP